MLIVVTAVIVVGGVYFYKKKMQPPTHDTVALTRVSYIIVFGSDRSSRNAKLRLSVCLMISVLSSSFWLISSG